MNQQIERLREWVDKQGTYPGVGIYVSQGQRYAFRLKYLSPHNYCVQTPTITQPLSYFENVIMVQNATIVLPGDPASLTQEQNINEFEIWAHLIEPIQEAVEYSGNDGVYDIYRLHKPTNMTAVVGPSNPRRRHVSSLSVNDFISHMRASNGFVDINKRNTEIKADLATFWSYVKANPNTSVTFDYKLNNKADMSVTYKDSVLTTKYPVIKGSKCHFTPSEWNTFVTNNFVCFSYDN